MHAALLSQSVMGRNNFEDLNFLEQVELFSIIIISNPKHRYQRPEWNLDKPASILLERNLVNSFNFLFIHYLVKKPSLGYSWRFRGQSLGTELSGAVMP